MRLSTYEWVMALMNASWYTSYPRSGALAFMYTIVGLTHSIDRCCFYDSIRNSLVALLEALWAWIYSRFDMSVFYDHIVCFLFRNMSHERVFAYQSVMALMNESWHTGYPRSGALAFVQNRVSRFETWKPHARFIYMFTYIIYIYTYKYMSM